MFRGRGRGRGLVVRNVVREEYEQYVQRSPPRRQPQPPPNQQQQHELEEDEPLQRSPRCPLQPPRQQPPPNQQQQHELEEDEPVQRSPRRQLQPPQNLQQQQQFEGNRYRSNSLEEMSALEEWLDTPHTEQIPQFIQDNSKLRKSQVNGLDGRNVSVRGGGFGRGGGANYVPISRGDVRPNGDVGRGHQFQRQDYEARGRGGISRGRGTAGNDIFGRTNVAEPVSNAHIVSNKMFQQSLMKQQLESSWDKCITERKQVSMTDPDFYASVKNAGKRSEGCDHLVIHTTCYHIPNRVFGVCARCYMIFCDEHCLKSGISNGKGRVGLASKELLEESFGISK